MIISDAKIFEQMESELAKAREATTKASQDKHLHGLMLLVQLAKTGDETGLEVEPSAIPKSEPAQIVNMDGKKIELEDGANGDSLLDF
ncbi:YwdI family protein [Listeria seeligeri]|uniref:YwdI family protein n=1 Tax=Listeria seeligeri TaxID=1640 RepID=UPI0022EBFA5D|nr:YwdI family protein [Listeria seeligeri]